MKTLMIILSIGFSSWAFADLGRKAPLKADFHNMIVNSDSERQSLANGINDDIVSNDKEAEPSESKKSLAEKKKVTDFIDVEIGWGEQPKMVDRRFDSINTPSPVQEKAVKPAPSQF